MWTGGWRDGLQNGGAGWVRANPIQPRNLPYTDIRKTERTPCFQVEVSVAGPESRVFLPLLV